MKCVAFYKRLCIADSKSEIWFCISTSSSVCFGFGAGRSGNGKGISSEYLGFPESSSDHSQVMHIIYSHFFLDHVIHGD